MTNLYPRSSGRFLSAVGSLSHRERVSRLATRGLAVAIAPVLADSSTASSSIVNGHENSFVLAAGGAPAQSPARVPAMYVR